MCYLKNGNARFLSVVATILVIKPSKVVSRLGGWRDRKGENEIDVMAVNDFEKTCDVYEVKRQASKINLAKLTEKVNGFKSKVKPEVEGHPIHAFWLSMEDM